MSKKNISALFAIAAFGFVSVGDANAQGVTRINQPVMTQQQSSQFGDEPDDNQEAGGSSKSGQHEADATT